MEDETRHPLPYPTECFPAAAMTDPQACFDAAGDEVKFRRSLQAMIGSCQRFIDFDRIDLVPASQYIVRPAAA